MRIAIDGPAGAGKSTISKAVAKKLGFVYIDTGAMYRSVGLAALRKELDPRSETDVSSILGDINIDIKNDGGDPVFFLNGEDVSREIRTPEASMAASDVAVIPAVRLWLVDLQRGLAEKSDVVMDGRDIGTYVLPDAELKIFLTASVEERARRRYAELAEKGGDVELESVMSEMIARDKNDSEREFAPLRQADDAVLVDSTDMTVDEVIAEIIRLAEEKKNDTL